MPTTQMNEVIRDLRRAVLRDGAGLSDADLLELFVRQRDEAALAALVHRHGPMVWGVCQRILSSHHDAEDAFQGTFLVLVRKAAAIQHKELVANWLYGVARQTALRARAAAYKRGLRERQVTVMPELATLDQDLWDDLRPLLDQELARLPDKYRVLIVLCDLQGKTRKEAAQELACAEGTIASRLARARAMLAKRLTRPGVTISAGILAAHLAAQTASASAPSAVVAATIQAASLFAAGHATAAAISAKALAYSEGVVKAMLMTKLKIAALWIAAVGVLTLAGSALHQALAETHADPQMQRQVVLCADEAQDAAQAPRGQPKDGAILKGKIGALDTQNRTVTLVINMFDRKSAESTEKEHVLPVAKDAVIFQDGVATKLGDLKRGFHTTLKIDQKTVVGITVEGSTVKGQFKSTNAERNTITVIAGRDMGEKIYHLLKTTKVTTEGGKDRKVGDLQAGAEIILTLSVAGDNTVMRIQAVVPETKKRGR